MMRSCIILGLVLAPLFAQAQDANYSKDDILKHFLQPSEVAEGKSEKSRTRAVNIGASIVTPALAAHSRIGAGR